MLFADHALARRLEAAEAEGARQYAWAYARIVPAAGAAWEDVAGGCAAYTGVGSPITQAQGLAVSEPISAAQLDTIEAFYRERGSRVQIMLCPLADPTLLPLLKERGYQLAEMENVLVRPISAADLHLPPPSGVTVRRAADSESDLFCRIVARGFQEHKDQLFQAAPVAEVDAQFLEIFRVAFGTAGNLSFLSFLNGTAIGGGSVFIHQGVAMLNGASTLPEFRARGSHAALYHARLRAAVEAGCDMARVVTQPGSTSQRNAERRGFRVAYTRAAMVREWAGEQHAVSRGQ